MTILCRISCVKSLDGGPGMIQTRSHEPDTIVRRRQPGRVGSLMPIRRELRPLYPSHWRELSRRVRFERAGGRCQRCERPHLALIRCLPDGRWFDEPAATWRDRRGKIARWPDLVEATRLRTTRVVLATAHLDGDPTNNRLTNLRALCQRCHMLHDRPQHLAQRWITYRRRCALGDLFLGPYAVLLAAIRSLRRTMPADRLPPHLTSRAFTAAIDLAQRRQRDAARLMRDDQWPLVAFSPPLHSPSQASSHRRQRPRAST
jgi:hypothetical protein